MLVEVVARNVTARSDTAFGLACRSHFGGVAGNVKPTRKAPYEIFGYALQIWDDGTYRIFVANPNRPVLLTQARSAQIPLGAAVYRIGASCVGATLTLFVNGKEIASVKDHTYATGRYGLAVGRDSIASDPREVRFTKFVVRAA